MDFNRLDLNLLLALDALLAERNTTRAAQRLNLSQSATSGALGRLRQHFGDELLILVGRHMVMTPLAARLQQPIRQILQQLRAALACHPEFVAQQSSRHFRVIASDYVVEVLLAKAIQRLSELAPNITFEILPIEKSCADKVSRCEADLVILPTSMAVDGLQQEVLLQDDYVCVAWAGNALATNTLTIEQYRNLGHVGSRLDQAGPAVLDNVLISFGAQRRVEVLANGFSQIPMLLMNTNRIAVLGKRLASQYANHFPLRLLPMPFAMPLRIECMQWLIVFDQDPAHIWFRQLLREIAVAE